MPDYTKLKASILHRLTLSSDWGEAGEAKAELERRERKHQNKIAVFNLVVAGLAAFASLIAAGVTLGQLLLSGKSGP